MSSRSFAIYYAKFAIENTIKIQNIAWWSGGTAGHHTP
jgi:hypothetical protein